MIDDDPWKTPGPAFIPDEPALWKNIEARRKCLGVPNNYTWIAATECTMAGWVRKRREESKEHRDDLK